MLVQLIAGQFHAAFVHLTQVADFQVVAALDVVACPEAILTQIVHAALTQLLQGLVEQRQVDLCVVQAHRQRGQLVVTDVRENLAEGA
ncbi:hypothetical protein D3C77_519540 [compost metagenome]